MTGSPLRRAVFLDRDGTLNEEKDYLHRVAELVLLPGVPEALSRLRRAGFLLIVVTNQSGVARGFFDERAVARLHRHLQRELQRRGAGIDGFYYCPHHPTEGVAPYRLACDCRKGAPGMLLQAAVEHGIDLAGSFMVGDKRADIEAGLAAGCRPILVRTGYGAATAGQLAGRAAVTVVVDDLAAAAEHILAGHAPAPEDN